MKPPKEYLKNLKHHTITEKMLSDCIYSINNRALNSRDNEYKYTHYIPNTYGKLSTDLSEDLDTWINKISSNME